MTSLYQNWTNKDAEVEKISWTGMFHWYKEFFFLPYLLKTRFLKSNKINRHAKWGCAGFFSAFMRLWLYSFGLILFVYATNLSAIDPATLNEIKAARRNDNFNEALRIERLALQKSGGDDVGVLSEMAVDYGHLKRFEEALECANRGLKIEGVTRKGSDDYVYISSSKAINLLELHRPGEAVQIADELISSYPTNVSSSTSVELIYEGVGRAQEALRVLQAVQLTHPECPHPSFCSGRLALKIGMYDKAEKYFRQAIAINPKSALYWSYLGSTLYQPLNGKTVPMSEGIKYSANSYAAYAKALKLDPSNVRALNGVRLIKGNFEISALVNAMGGGGGGTGEECSTCHGSGQEWRNSVSGSGFYRCDACNGTGRR